MTGISTIHKTTERAIYHNWHQPCCLYFQSVFIYGFIDYMGAYLKCLDLHSKSEGLTVLRGYERNDP